MAADPPPDPPAAVAFDRVRGRDMNVHVGDRIYHVGAGEAQPGTPDLDITSLENPGRLRPLAGHPVLARPADGRPVYSGGVHLSFTLSHNGAGRASVLVRGLSLEIVRFVPGADPDYAHRPEGAAIIGAGIVKPHVFTVSLFGDEAAPARWVVDAAAGQVRTARSANFFDTEDAQLLSVSPEGDVEEVRGTILAQEEGLYEVRLAWDYSVKGEDRRRVSEPILLYSDD